MAKEGYNVLGSAVKIDKVPKNSKAHFVPTDSHVQIIGHRGDSKKELFGQKETYNAFYFIEMTGNLIMPI